MKKVISNTFSITAERKAVSIAHTDHYYLTESTGTAPGIDDPRWKFVPAGGTPLSPTSSEPFLWRKFITYFSDGSSLKPVVEFVGSMGQNGIDYDLVPSASSIVRSEDGSLSPSTVSCVLIKRESDGSVTKMSSLPLLYSVWVARDNVEEPYTLGDSVSTNDCSVISFILKYGSGETTDVERHDIRVIAEGSEGLAGRGIKTQEVRFKSTVDNVKPSAPSTASEWSTWSSLDGSQYSASRRYLWRCTRTVFIDGNGVEDTVYVVDGPTVWGQDGLSPVSVDLDNEADVVPVDASGTLLTDFSVQTSVRVYKGGEMQQSGVSIPQGANLSINGISPVARISDGVIALRWTFLKGKVFDSARYSVAVQVLFEGKVYQKEFSLGVVRSGEAGVSPTLFQLMLSQTELTFSRNADNSLSPSVVRVNCGYTRLSAVGWQPFPGTVRNNLYKDGGAPYNIFYRQVNRDGTYGSWMWMKDCPSDYNYALSVSNGTTAAAYEFILSDASGVSGIADANTIDRESLPIRIEAKSGNGIVTDDFYYQLTATFEPPSTADLSDGWILRGAEGCPTEPTSSNPFLWECENIEYSDLPALNKRIVRLLRTFNLSPQPNLLEQTSFNSEDAMSAWTERNGEVVPNSHGAFHAFGGFPSAAEYTNLLKQPLNIPGGKTMLEPSSWYTLSFYLRTRRRVEVAGYAYNFFTQRVYLHPGTYKLQFNGQCSAASVSAGVRLRGLISANAAASAAMISAVVMAEVSSAASSTVTTASFLSVTRGGWHYLHFYCYKSAGVGGSGTENVGLNWYRLISLDDQSHIASFVFPSALLSGSTFYVDGVARPYLSSDGVVEWTSEEQDAGADFYGWTFHSFTFRTKSSIPSAEQSLLFRLYNTYAEISQPKLEKSVMPTEWCENARDDADHCTLNPCGTWAPGTTYFYCNGVRDAVRCEESASSLQLTWWRLRRRTNAIGYTSDLPPYSDTEHWEQANQMKFTVVDAMFTELVYTDKVISSRFESKNKTFEVDEEGNVKGHDCTFENATLDHCSFNSGTFVNGRYSGFLKSAQMSVTDQNINNIMPDSSTSTSPAGREFNIEAAGSWVSIEYMPPLPAVTGVNNWVLNFPIFANLNLDNVRSFLGSTILLYNRTDYDIKLAGSCEDVVSTKEESEKCMMHPDDMAQVVCKMRVRADGYEDLYWEVTIAKRRSS